MTALCVVDMQDYFTTSHMCLRGVVKEVELAMARNAPIIVLEYYDCGRTSSAIRRLIKDYRKTRYVKKYNDGGGIELLSTMARNGWSSNEIRFAGVNRSFCVLETIMEVHEKLRDDCNIQIAIDATWCTEPTHGKEALSEYGVFVETPDIQIPTLGGIKHRDLEECFF